MTDNVTNRTLNWDSTITEDSKEFLVVPEGDFAFQVTNFERARYEGGSKMPACNKAVITLRVRLKQADGTYKYATVMTNFFLLGSMEWKIAQFFLALGMKKRGEPLKMDFPGAVGKKGYAHFKPRTFKNNDGEDMTVSDIQRFYDYDEKHFADDDPDTWGADTSGFVDVTETETDTLPF